MKKKCADCPEEFETKNNNQTRCRRCQRKKKNMMIRIARKRYIPKLQHRIINLQQESLVKSHQIDNHLAMIKPLNKAMDVATASLKEAHRKNNLLTKNYQQLQCENDNLEHQNDTLETSNRILAKNNEIYQKKISNLDEREKGLNEFEQKIMNLREQSIEKIKYDQARINTLETEIEKQAADHELEITRMNKSFQKKERAYKRAIEAREKEYRKIEKELKQRYGYAEGSFSVVKEHKFSDMDSYLSD